MVGEYLTEKLTIESKNKAEKRHKMNSEKSSSENLNNFKNVKSLFLLEST